MKLHRKIAAALGYDLIKTRKNHLTLDSHLSILFGTLNIDCVLDVGANIGQYGLMLRKMGYQGRIISFEPVKSIFDQLQKTTEGDELWDVHNFALGEKPEQKTINVTASSDFSSFLSPSEYAKGNYAKSSEILTEETVSIERLDDRASELIPNINKANIHLKIDTQGYDLEVIKGSQSTLPLIISMQSELSVIPVYQGSPDYIDSLTTYRRLGYEVTGIYPVSRDNKSQILIEFDCVMRRKDPRVDA